MPRVCRETAAALTRDGNSPRRQSDQIRDLGTDGQRAALRRAAAVTTSRHGVAPRRHPLRGPAVHPPRCGAPRAPQRRARKLQRSAVIAPDSINRRHSRSRAAAARAGCPSAPTDPPQAPRTSTTNPSRCAPPPAREVPPRAHDYGRSPLLCASLSCSLTAAAAARAGRRAAPRRCMDRPWTSTTRIPNR